MNKQLTKIVQNEGFKLGQKFAWTAKQQIQPGCKVSLSDSQDCRFICLGEDDDIQQFQWDQAWRDWEDDYGDRPHDYTLILLGRPCISEYSTALLFEQLDDAVYKGIQSVLGKDVEGFVFPSFFHAQKHHCSRNERILEYVTFAGGRVKVTAINAWD